MCKKFMEVIGYALRLCGVPMAELVAMMLANGKKTLVGYSYNGTILPGLPVWDKSKYPYAYISYYITGDTYYLYVLSKPLNYTRYSTVISGTYYGESEGVWLHGTSYMKCALNKADFEWGALNTSSATAECHVNTSGERLSTMIWANYNVINGFDGGSLYLAKSDPVPVYV